MIGPTVKSAVGATLELLLNQALKLDPASRLRLAALAGRCFHIECTQPNVNLFVLPQREFVQIAGDWDGPVSAGLRGSFDDFMQLLTSADPGTALINGNLQVQGDSQLLLQLRAIVADLDIDWEAPLVSVFGDVLGHQIGRGASWLHAQLRATGSSVARQLRDYVKEESDWLAPHWQVEDFRSQVQQLSARSEQLESRINQLRQQMARRGFTPPGWANR